MKIIIYGQGEDAQKLHEITKNSIEDVGLSEYITLETSQDESLKTELSFQESPAFIIQEESIDFKDMIFEGIVPEPHEITSMLLSIVGGGAGEDGCSGHCSSGGCGSSGCESGCC